jgi:hypothetical protein
MLIAGPCKVTGVGARIRLARLSAASFLEDHFLDLARCCIGHAAWCIGGSFDSLPGVLERPLATMNSRNARDSSAITLFGRCPAPPKMSAVSPRSFSLAVML